MITSLLFVFVFVIGILMISSHKQFQEKVMNNQQNRELNELLDQLDYLVKANNQEVITWKHFHSHNEDLGEPSAMFNGHIASRVTLAPWNCAELAYDRNEVLSQNSNDLRIKKALALLANFETQRVHDICNSAIFFEEARVAVINMTTYNPKDIISMKKKVNRDDDTVTFTITVNNMLDPIEEITLLSDKAELFKSTMTVFRKMK